MADLKTLRREAVKFGATVSYGVEGDMNVCRVEAPKGRHWIDGVHEFVDCAYRPWKPDYEDLLSRMSYGHEACDDNCEWWSEE